MNIESSIRGLRGGFLLAVVTGVLSAVPAPAAEPDTSPGTSGPSDGDKAAAAVGKPSIDTMGGDIVPDCNGGTTLSPYWLTRILFQGAFCVQAPKNSQMRVDFGTTLVAHDDFINGKLHEHQAYYSLSQIVVPAGQRRVVWAVCGGAGASLPNGTRVVPTVRMDAVRSSKIGALIRELENEETEYNNVLTVWRGTKEPATQTFLKDRLEIIRESIETQTGPLRAALIQENHSSLRGAGLPMAPTWGEDH